jgi:4-hydroxy-3-polyprenylbenzoate decarboxylase
VEDFNMENFVVAITGASGIHFGIEIARAISCSPSHTLHLIVSKGASKVIEHEVFGKVYETFLNLQNAETVRLENDELDACISSGSYRTFGMVVAPCSIATLSDIAYSRNRSLIVRAADVHIKEGRKVVLMVRETPLHKGHLELMLKAADLGYVIMPPVPSFYDKPKTVEDIVNQTTGRVLDQFDIHHGLCKRWI